MGNLKPLYKSYYFTIYSTWQYKIINVSEVYYRYQDPRRVLYTLQRTNTENLKQIFPEKELRATVQILTFICPCHVSVSDLYIPRISPHISCSRIGRSIVGEYINRSRTHECGN
jgi:hypothetical protein